MKITTLAWTLALLTGSPLLLLAQEEHPEPPVRAEEEFPHWKVSGVLSTDFNGLVSDRGSRDTMPEEGVVGEYALGGDLHISRELSLSVRACVGCHGFELQSAYADFELLKGLTVRAGRLPVPFGGFSRRTSPAQLESTSKPLPYIMGHMVREREFNMGIVPAPFLDNGAAVAGNAWLGESVQLGFEGAVVRGLKGGTADISFDLSRDFEDDNGEPAGAARLTLTAGPLTLGGSAMVGHYDPKGDLSYQMAGADVHLQIGPFNLRGEAILRDTEFLDPLLDEDTSRRRAYAVQVDVEVHPQWRIFALSDGLEVEDLFLTPSGPSPLPLPGSVDDSNSILRSAAGAIFAFRPGVLVKASAEYWNFSDFDDTWVFHFTFVVAF